MVCAVADVVKEVPEAPVLDSEGRGDAEEHALFAEALELDPRDLVDALASPIEN